MQINYFLKKITEVIFPDNCVFCGVRSHLLCNICIKKLSPSQSSEQEFITSIFSYRDLSIKRLIWLLKYKNAKRVAKIFAPYIANAIVEFLGEERLFLGENTILLIPVPLSNKRYKKRGYNQSEILAREIASILIDEKNIKNVYIEKNLVEKNKDTIPQAEIKKRSLRLLNQNDCFSVLPNHFSKREIIILIDDVTTTGATLSVIRKILRTEGFRKIYAFTIAH